MLRRLVKDAAAHAVSWTRLDALAQANRYRHVPFVVAYHRVVEQLNVYDGFALPAMEISVATLEKHLDWLERRFRVVSLDDLPAELERPPGSKPLAAVTFDDGYSDVFHHGFPLLKRKGIPAGIFVITDLVGTGELPMHERLHALLVGAWSRWTSRANELGLPKTIHDAFSATQYLLRHFPYAEVQRIINDLDVDGERSRMRPAALQPLSWEMLTAMRDAGMTIGSHSKTHAFLANESKERTQEEAAESRRGLRQKLGTAVTCFAYPGGVFNKSVVESVDAAGYRYAFTVCRHRDPQHPLLTIPRTMLWERSSLDRAGRFSPAIMSCHAAGAFERASICRFAHAASLS
ncbi:MAG TPA: polysaccharide deacetylase family protein [Thermoanaerobaculia bacterium]